MFARRAFTFTLVIAAIAASSGCGKTNPNEITVGAYLSLSGADSTFGTDTREGIELAIDQTNAEGGVKGKRVRVLFEDDKSNALEASQKVRQLIDRDKVVALLGEVASSRSLAGGLIANTRHVPMVSPSSTAVSVTKGRPWVFRTTFTDEQQGAVAARYVKNELKRTRIGIFYAAQDTYSSGLAKSFREEMKRLGGDIVIDKGYPKGESNFRTYLSALKDVNPDAIFVPNYYNEMALVARQAKDVGLAGSLFVGGDGWDSSNLVEASGDALEGAHFTNAYAPDVPWENSKAFLHAFVARFKHRPTSIAAQGYDAARLLFDAIGRATEAKPEAIRKALTETKDFKGATGTMTIDSERNANKPVVIVEITGGQFKFATEIMVR